MAQGHALQISPGLEDVAGTALSVRDGMADGAASGNGLTAQEATGGNVEKIRDILFGPQMRDYELRFVRLEEQITKDLSDVRDTMRKRSDAIEGYVRTELEALQGRLRNEREDRSSALRQLGRNVGELSENLSRKIDELDEQSAQAQRQLRSDLLEFTKAFSDDLAHKQEEMTALVDKRFQELRKGKTDRAALATLLTEMSLKLSGELAKNAEL